MKLINKMSNYKLYLIGVIAVGIIIYVGNKLLGDNNTSAESSSNLVTATVQKGAVIDSISASGNIETANYLAVTTSVNGIVKEVFVNEGDNVTKGQKLMDVTLNSDGEESLASAKAAYLSAKNSLASAKASLVDKESKLISAKEAFQNEKENNSYQSHDERISYKLAENDVITAQSDYDTQKASISEKEISLNKSWLTYQAQSPTIVAPDSGTIANIVVVEGMEISNSLSERTSSTVASIRKTGAPIASVNISEVDINNVQVGQKVYLTLDSIADKKFTGKVVGIDRIGTSSSGVSNYPVIIKFDEESDLVLPNMGVDVEIVINEKEAALYVPAAAVKSINGKTVVNVKDGELSKDVDVETGISTNEYTEIISGLDEGDTILLETYPTTGFTSTENSKSGGVGMMMPGMGGGR